MGALYGPSTRAASRSVASVTTFKTPGALTRSGEEATPLAYIVNFEEGGFSVLGAHASVPSILCITDEGQFTPEEVESISREIETYADVAATRIVATPPLIREPVEDDDQWMNYEEIHNYGYPDGNPEPFDVNDYNIDWDPDETTTEDTGDWLEDAIDDSYIKESTSLSVSLRRGRSLRRRRGQSYRSNL